MALSICGKKYFQDQLDSIDMPSDISSIISLPLRRYVSLMLDDESKLGWVEIVSYAQVSEAECQCYWQIDLDVQRTGHISGVDLFQALELTFALLKTHVERCGGEFYYEIP